MRFLAYFLSLLCLMSVVGTGCVNDNPPSDVIDQPQPPPPPADEAPPPSPSVEEENPPQPPENGEIDTPDPAPDTLLPQVISLTNPNPTTNIEYTFPIVKPVEASPTPTFESQFGTTSSSQWKKLLKGVNSNIQFGITNPDATDNLVAQLMLKGNAALGPADEVGPSHSSEIQSLSLFGYGRYITRVKGASCSPSEEVVSGIFTYRYGGDENTNGITDNSEIDIEILCSEPESLYFTIWTDYDDSSSFSKITRKVNLATGDIYETPGGAGATWGVKKIGNLGFQLSSFSATSRFNTLGFEWSPNAIRFFIRVRLGDVELWNYTQPTHIPLPDARFLYNVWHSDEHWDGAGIADYPAHNAMMDVDWFQFYSMDQ